MFASKFLKAIWFERMRLAIASLTFWKLYLHQTIAKLLLARFKQF